MFRLLGIIVVMTYAIMILDVEDGAITLGKKIYVSYKEKNLIVGFISRRSRDFVIK